LDATAHFKKPEEIEEVRFLLIFFGWGRISLFGYCLNNQATLYNFSYYQYFNEQIYLL